MNYMHAYFYQGCRDSTIYTLAAASVGTVNAAVSGTVCPGTSVGIAAISFTPSPGTSGSNVFDVSSNVPGIYSNVQGPISSNNILVTNLPDSQGYTVTAFDGSCYAGTTFTLNPVVPPFDYSLSPANGTVCQGVGGNVGVNFSTSPTTQFTYSWSPTIFLAGGNGTLQSTVISPTANSGTTSTYVYSVTVKPAIANCPLTKTVVITVANPAVPYITPVPPLCNNSPAYSVIVTPTGGIFPGAPPGLSSTGVITPSIAGTGTSILVYATMIGSCAAASVSSFTINAAPVLQVGNGATVCAAQPTTLSASGANSYTWMPVQLFGSIVNVYVAATTVYTVTGKDSNNCLGTASVVIVADPCVGIPGQSSLQDLITIYPNPGKGIYNVSSGREICVEIYNQLGQLILEKNFAAGTYLLDLSMLSNGIYYVTVRSQQEVSVIKLIKEN
jgi:hypothetical protein